MTMKEEEEKEGEFKACSSWEEEIYWTHFQFTHFFRLLHAGFHLTLEMPTKFSNSLKSKLPKTVILTGPSGANWTVELTKTAGGTTFFSRGWKKFAADNSLQVDDLLVFKYNGDSHFDVLILQSQTSCEKAAAYFAKKRKKNDGGGDKPPSVISGEREIINENSGGGVYPASPPSSCDGIGPAEEKDVQSPGSSTDWPHVSSGECKKRAKVKDKAGKSRRVGELNRTAPVTEESKREALRLASFAAHQDSFISVMKTSSVRSAYYLSVPSWWMKKHVKKYWEMQDVILKAEEKEWPVKFRPKKKKEVITGGFGGGWRNFARDNHLQLFDVCVFQPCTPTPNSTLVLDVTIFRCLTTSM